MMTRGVDLVVVFGLLLTMAGAAWGQPPGGEALATVRRAGDASVPLLGFVADDAGHVVANVQAADANSVIGEDFVVHVAENEYAAQGIAYDPNFRLGLLRVTSDPPPAPYPFAREPAEQGRAVYGAMKDNETRNIVVRLGSINRIEPDGSDDPATIRHNALVGERRHGAPLFNNCGEVIGVVVENTATPGVGLALSAEWVENTFGGAGLTPVRADETCLSEADRMVEAEESRREAERQATAAELARIDAEAARIEAERARDAAEAARMEAEEARREAEQRASEAEETRDAAEAARMEAEETRDAAVVTGALVSVLLAGLWLTCRQSRDRAVQRAEKAEAAGDAEGPPIGQTPDFLLTGADSAGAEIALRVAGCEIARSSGVVVGQSPFNRKLVPNPPGKWDRHFRLFVENGSLRFENIGSPNDISLNGARLDRDASRAISDGMLLRVGEIGFAVQLQRSGEGR